MIGKMGPKCSSLTWPNMLGVGGTWGQQTTDSWFCLEWKKVMIRWWQVIFVGELTGPIYRAKGHTHTHIILVVRYDKMVVCVRISFEQMFRGIWMSRVYSCKSQVLCWDIPQLIFASKYKPIYVQYNLHIGVDCLRGHVSRLYLPKLA